VRGHRHVAAHHRPERDDETDNDNTSDQLKSLLENPPKNIKINLKVDKKQRQGDTPTMILPACCTVKKIVLVVEPLPRL